MGNASTCVAEVKPIVGTMPLAQLRAISDLVYAALERPDTWLSAADVFPGKDSLSLARRVTLEAASRHEDWPRHVRVRTTRDRIEFWVPSDLIK